MNKKEHQRQATLRKDRVANRVEIAKMHENSKNESMIFKCECIAFVLAYGSILKARKQTILN